MGRGSGMERSDAPVGGIQRVADRGLESADDELSVAELNSRGDSLDEKVESLLLGDKGVVVGVGGEVMDHGCI